MRDVFHVSQLKKCLRVPSEAVEIEAIQLEPDLTYQERPIKILDQKEQVTEDDQLNRTRCNGVITQEKKLHGKQKSICELITQSFSTKEEICTYSVKGDLHLFCNSNLQLASLNSQGSPKVNCKNT